jgi:3',5'-nucleoside bisphosphate phosphatase
VAMALTDHDTIAGVTEAVAEGERLGVRVVAGCEFSVAAPWGEMHVLGYHLPLEDAEVEDFLVGARTGRATRARRMVGALQAWGVDIEHEDVEAEAAGGAIGRPHVARVLVRRGKVESVDEAFNLYLGRGRPGYVDKVLPSFREVADLVHRAGGLVSAAHLRDRATRSFLSTLQGEGLDAVEALHPSHSPDTRTRIKANAAALGLLTTGGSDWHGGGGADHSQSGMGSESVPAAWLEAMDSRRETQAAR